MLDLEKTRFELINTLQGPKKIAYGIEFSATIPDYMIELHCCFRYHLTLEKGGIGPKYHFWNFVEEMYPEFCQRDNFFMDIFFENVIEGDDKFVFAIGPGGFGKTTLAALYVIGAWIENPKETAVITCTTTAEAAEGRIWGKVKHLFNKHPHFKEFAKVTEKRIYYSQKMPNGKTDKDTFHCMKMSPLPRGNSGADAVLRGIHPDKKLILILDEMDQSAAIDDVVDNLQRGDVDFKLIGLGNPNDRFSALGLSCEPFGGWDSIDPHGFKDIKDCAWDSVIDDGRVLFFPGYLNPRIVLSEKYPEKAEYYNNRFSYFSTRDELQEKKKTVGYNKWMEQYIGFFPEQNTAGISYMLDKHDITINNVAEKAFFSGHDTPILFASADIGFTSGGDQTIVRYAKLGHMANGKKGLCFLGPEHVKRIQIPKNLSDHKYRWLAEQIYNEVTGKGVQPQHFSLDMNSAGDAVLEHLYEMWSTDIYCISSRGPASDRPLYYGNNTTARDECTNKITEYWLMMKKFILTQQIKGLDQVTIQQLCSRAIIRKSSSPKVTIEPKDDYKKRMTSIGRIGKSPDEADAAAYILDNARNFDFYLEHGDADPNEASRIWHNKNQESVDEFLLRKQAEHHAQSEVNASTYYDSSESDSFSILDFDSDEY